MHCVRYIFKPIMTKKLFHIWHRNSNLLDYIYIYIYLERERERERERWVQVTPSVTLKSYTFFIIPYLIHSILISKPKKIYNTTIAFSCSLSLHFSL